MKINVPKGKRVNPNFQAMGIISKKVKPKIGPIVNRPAKDTRAGSVKP